MRDNIPRFVQTYEPDIMVSARRSVSFDIPVFTLDGSLYESYSSPFMAEKTLILTRWYIVAGVAYGPEESPTDSKFSLTIGDTDLYRDGKSRKELILPKYSRYVGADLKSPTGYLVLTARQWVRIDCTVAGGHESVTVKIESEVM
jgi:hypothetical protein